VATPATLGTGTGPPYLIENVRLSAVARQFNSAGQWYQGKTLSGRSLSPFHPDRVKVRRLTGLAM